MIKNEERRIGWSISRLLEGGVDLVVVADNDSTDASREVVRGLAGAYPVVLVHDREPAYYQGPKMSRLARAAAQRGAAWIIPFDADELWFAPTEPLADFLRYIDGDAVFGQMQDFLPVRGTSGLTNSPRNMTRRLTRPGPRKIAFRAHLLASINSGNHWVAQPVRVDRDAQLTVRHYPYLDFEHFVAKARQGLHALSLTDFPANIGEHWRELGSAAESELCRRWDELLSQETVEDPLPPALASPTSRGLATPPFSAP